MGTINFTPSKPGAKPINFTPANNTPAPQQDQGFFSNVKNDLINRAKNLKDTAIKTYQGKYNPLVTGLATVGDVAGGVGDIIGEGVKSLAKTAWEHTPDFITKPTKEAAMSVLQSDIGREGLNMAAKGMEYYDKWKNNNPQTAKSLESIVNIASIAPIGEAAKVAEKGGEAALKGAGTIAKGAGKAVESTGKYAAAQASGLSMKTIENIIANPNALTEAEKAGLDALHLGSRVKNAIDNRVGDLRSTGKAYEVIRQGKEMVNVPREVITNVLDKYGIKLDDAGKIITSAESVPLKPGDIASIENFVKQYGHEILSGNAFMNARTALSQMADYGSDKSSFSKLISRALRKSYDTLGKEQLGKGASTGLAALDAIYAPEKTALNALKKEFIDRTTGELKDTALTRIVNATNEGKQNVINRLEQLVPGITEDINMFKALKDIEAVKSQKVGAYASNAFKSGLGGFAISGGSPIFALAGMVLTSPQVVVPILKNYGRLKGFSTKIIDGIINKMKGGVSLLDNEKKIINNSLIDAASKIKTVAAPGEADAATKIPNVKLKSDMSINGGSRINLDGLNQEGKAMEAAAFNKVDSSKDQIIADYEKQHGKIYNPDDFRPFVHDEKTFGPYDGTKAANVHEPVSEISNYIKNKRIGEVNPGEAVMWTSGGPGSGKTTAIKAVNQDIYNKIKFGYDSVLGNPSKASKDINNVLEKGGKNFIPHVVRDVEDAWMNGVVARAISKGRTVPLKVFLDGTEKANKAVKSLYNEFSGNKNVMIAFLDNRTPGGKAKEMTFDQFNKIDMNNLEGRFYDKLYNETQKLYEDGRITKKIRDGLLGN